MHLTHNNNDRWCLGIMVQGYNATGYNRKKNNGISWNTAYAYNP